MSQIQTWFDNMKDIWLQKKPEDISNLLSKNFKYYENPFKEPLTNTKDVIDAWQEIKKQNIEYIIIDIIYATPNTGVATWKFKEYNKNEHIGSYYLELDNNGKCTHFRQWWMENKN